MSKHRGTIGSGSRCVRLEKTNRARPWLCAATVSFGGEIQNGVSYGVPLSGGVTAPVTQVERG